MALNWMVSKWVHHHFTRYSAAPLCPSEHAPNLEPPAPPPPLSLPLSLPSMPMPVRSNTYVAESPRPLSAFAGEKTPKTSSPVSVGGGDSPMAAPVRKKGKKDVTGRWDRSMTVRDKARDCYRLIPQRGNASSNCRRAKEKDRIRLVPLQDRCNVHMCTYSIT